MEGRSRVLGAGLLRVMGFAGWWLLVLLGLRSQPGSVIVGCSVWPPDGGDSTCTWVLYDLLVVGGVICRRLRQQFSTTNPFLGGCPRARRSTCCGGVCAAGAPCEQAHRVEGF
jgi:hypothetical protein